MKYKNYQEVLKAPDYLGAMKQYLKDKGMTHEEWSVSEEARKAAVEAAKFRLSGPLAYTSRDPKNSMKK